MTAVVNFITGCVQERNIKTRQDLDNYNKTMEGMKYTPWVDLVLSIICSIGATIALEAGLAHVGIGLLVFAVIFLIGATFLKLEDKTNEIILRVNLLWNLKLQNAF